MTAFWHSLAVVAQSVLLFVLGAWLMRERTVGELTFVIALSALAYSMALHNGVPAWRDWDVGDAYDIAAFVWIAICFCRGGR